MVHFYASGAVSLGLLATDVNALLRIPGLDPRALPATAEGVKTIKTPSGATIRYKDPGEEGICETTPGVKSFSGYIDIAPDAHTFFWFFEARKNPATAQTTLWLNGGPGSDSLIGLFQELGPCAVNENLTTYINEHSWSSESNLLFLSQPLGAGFSYSQALPGSHDNNTGEFVNASAEAPPDGRWPVIDAELLDTTELAAVAAYHVLQGFYSALLSLASEVQSKVFNLWTESYGGHYGPAFFDYFYEQNELIKQGKLKGVELNFNTLGIGNGIIDEYTQSDYYPEFATNNSYGIRSVNDTIYSYMKFANEMRGGCKQQVANCKELRELDYDSPLDLTFCESGAYMCRDNVEGPYMWYSGRSSYDIRAPQNDTTIPDYFVPFLNQAHVQQAIGTNLNYTSSNTEVFYAFQETGDFVYPDFMADLEDLLNAGVRVALYYGDADYICNWMGDEAVSLAVNYTHAEQFRKAGYEKLVVDGREYGEVRQVGNFSFTRIWDAGHLVPFYQPVASLAMFERTINHRNVADGTKGVSDGLVTSGDMHVTHTESSVALPSATSSSVPGELAQMDGRQRSGPIIPMKRKARGLKTVKRDMSEEEWKEKRRSGYGIGRRFSKRLPDW